MEYQRSTAHPPQRPTIVYDGDCGFCTFWVRRWQCRTGDSFAWAPFQEGASAFPDLPLQTFKEAVQLIQPSGKVINGADAVLMILRADPRWQALAQLLANLPFVLPILRFLYGIVAGNREFFSLLTRFLWGSDPRPPTYAVGRRVFSGALGVVFIAAFASLAPQVRALYSTAGIMPSAEFLTAAREQLGSSAFWQVPTVFWIDVSDTALMAACLVGIAFGFFLLAGIWPGGSALICWGLYLSLCSVGSPFLNFQWDTLLLETALISALFLPWSLRPRWNEFSGVSMLGRFLLAWLLFRLMLESGAVKLSSGDPTWANLTALNYHFETQPLPLWTAWYAHHASPLLLKVSVLATFAIEFIAPLGIFAPRRLRHLAAWLLIALQAGIMTTGNYAFFNWLTIALCLPLFDDTSWPALRRRRVANSEVTKPARARWPTRIALVGSIPVLILTTSQLVSSFRARWEWPGWLASLQSALAPLRSFNSYGLFAIMTTERPEIIVEGSNDGQVWHAYEFRWKPGDLKRRPELVAPHQPRIDWQMWFAALGDIRQNPWFIRFLACLLNGSPEVLEQLAWNPFPNHPPKYVRAVLYDYRFTPSDKPGTAWWAREPRGIYCPPISLSGQ